MNTTKDDGGAAFPLHLHMEGAGGMTLRDYFAAMALQGLCANPSGPYSETDPLVCGPDNRSTLDVARESYDLADAMLAARKGES
jgi:hypothetical protein